MWLVGETACNSPIMVTSMRLFDNQKDAEDYAKTLHYHYICYWFEKPNEKFKKRFKSDYSNKKIDFTP